MIRTILGNVKEWRDLTLFPSPHGEGCQAVFFSINLCTKHQQHNDDQQLF